MGVRDALAGDADANVIVVTSEEVYEPEVFASVTDHRIHRWLTVVNIPNDGAPLRLWVRTPIRGRAALLAGGRTAPLNGGTRGRFAHLARLVLLPWRSMESELDMHLPSLLLWLDEQAHERHGEYVDVSAYAGDEPGAFEFIGLLVTVLEDRGLVDVARGLNDRPDSQITKQGKVEAQRIREKRADRVARMWFARDTIIQWLFAEYPTYAGDLQQFLTWKGSAFLGDLLTNDEVSEAVRYLEGRDLVTVTNLARTHVRLTTNGIDCATSGGSVSDYLSSSAQQPGGAPVFHIGTNYGNIAANSSQFTQNAASGSVDVAVLREFASLVRQLAPALTPLGRV